MARRRTYPGSIEKRGEAFRVDLVVAGERCRKTLRGVTREQVEAFLRQKHEEMRADADRRIHHLPLGDGTVLSLISDFRADHFPDLEPRTRSSYDTTLKLFSTYLATQPRLRSLSVRDVSPRLIRGFLNWVRDNSYIVRAQSRRKVNPKPQTIRRHRATLHKMFNYAVNELEIRDYNPVSKVKTKKSDEFDPVILGDRQYDALLDECGKRDPMVSMYALFLGETGARSMSEALWLQWEDVDLAGGWVRIVQGRDGHRTKTGKGRDVPMTQRLHGAMRQHFANYRFHEYERREGDQKILVRSPWVFHHLLRRRHAEAGDRFYNLHRSVKSAAADAGIERRWRLHDLRHRRATTWIAAGKSPVKVQRALGHSSIQTTMKYTHLVKDHLRSLVEDDSSEVRFG